MLPWTVCGDDWRKLRPGSFLPERVSSTIVSRGAALEPLATGHYSMVSHRHHFLPQCYLKGFARSEKRGNPRGPTERLTRVSPRLTRTPGISLMDRRKRQPITYPLRKYSDTSAPIATGD
jgi:hypothetical protein